jgi:thiol-disulfide isomerase/thioredoxin
MTRIRLALLASVLACPLSVGCGGQATTEHKPVGFDKTGRPRPGAAGAGPSAATIESEVTPEGKLQFAQDRIAQMSRAQRGGDAGGMKPEQIEAELYKAFIQAGEAAQELLKSDKTDLDQDFGGVFYNYACALAKQGDLEKSKEVLAQSVEHGFTQLGHIEKDVDLAALHQSEDWTKLREQLAAIAERVIGLEVEKEFKEFKSFPFAFELPTVDGDTLKLDSLKGKVVIADIWGTWCPPCRKEVPHFVELQNRYGGEGLQIVGLNYERKPTKEEEIATIKQFAAANNMNYPLVLGDESTLEQVPGFRGYPTTLFIDRAGKVRFVAVGFHELGYLELVVRKLLSESSEDSSAQEA